jgi:hypothetical protein
MRSSEGIGHGGDEEGRKQNGKSVRGTDGRKGSTEIGKRVKGLAGRLIPYLTISTTIWTAQS